MKCWVCKRQARGYGHTDTRHKPGDPKRYPLDWVFCSVRCQGIFHQTYGRLTDAQQKSKDFEMIDSTEQERAAMQKCLKFFGEAASEIGFTKPLGDYSEAQALQVIEAIITGYSEAMVEHHEATRVPAVAGVKEPIADPMAGNAWASLKDDLPWEDKP